MYIYIDVLFILYIVCNIYIYIVCRSQLPRCELEDSLKADAWALQILASSRQLRVVEGFWKGIIEAGQMF